VFVLESIERHVTELDRTLLSVGWIVGGIGAVLVALFLVLTRLDRRRAGEFEAELARRRRARRERGKGLAGSAAP
jgi:hypothetical protein